MLPSQAVSSAVSASVDEMRSSSPHCASIITSTSRTSSRLPAKMMKPKLLARAPLPQLAGSERLDLLGAPLCETFDL